MPRSSERGGPQTRARIARVAGGMFHERGFDAVTVAEIAREAGVSSVTVFNHFPRKEDLFFDRSDEAAELLRSALRTRGAGTDAIDALRTATLRLVDERHPLSGLDERSVPYFRAVAGSPALIGRAREIAADLQAVLAAELAGDPASRDDAALVAAFFVAGYGSVLVETGRRLIAGEPHAALLDDHRARIERLFTALRTGVSAR